MNIMLVLKKITSYKSFYSRISLNQLFDQCGGNIYNRVHILKIQFTYFIFKTMIIIVIIKIES